ncbi:MAG: hypothetical protein IPM96_17345 [Ignavibacteria bacterium]|nr:hypothetical protein [Ignavibacteria bacterium]
MKILIILMILLISSNIIANINSKFPFNYISNEYELSTSDKFEKFKIGYDESLEYMYLYKENFVMLLIKMNAKNGLMNSSSEYIYIEKSDKKN